MVPMSHPPSSRRSADLDLALGALVDEPRHVEPRGLLLGGHGIAVLGAGEASGFVFASQFFLVAGFGVPDPDLIEALDVLVDESGLLRDSLTVHVPAEVSGPWCDALGVRPSATLSVQRLEPADPAGDSAGEPARWEGEREVTRHVVEQIQGADDPRLGTLGRGLREDLEAQERWPVVFAAMAGGGIASIASAAVETERYFDISIETVRAFRGEGFGRAAARGLIQHQLARGKAPVWIVKTSNRASQALAASLGFAETAQLASLRLTA